MGESICWDECTNGCSGDMHFTTRKGARERAEARRGKVWRSLLVWSGLGWSGMMDAKTNNRCLYAPSERASERKPIKSSLLMPYNTRIAELDIIKASSIHEPRHFPALSSLFPFFFFSMLSFPGN